MFPFHEMKQAAFPAMSDAGFSLSFFRFPPKEAAA